MIPVTIISIGVIVLGLVVWLIQKIATKLVMDEIFFQIRNRGYVQKLCHSLIRFAALQYPKEDRQLFFEDTVPNTEELISRNRILAAVGNSFSIIWNTKWSLYFVWILCNVSCICAAIYVELGAIILLASKFNGVLTVITKWMIIAVFLSYSAIYYFSFLARNPFCRWKPFLQISRIAYFGLVILSCTPIFLFTILTVHSNRIYSITIIWFFWCFAMTFCLWISTFLYKRLSTHSGSIN